MFTFTKIQTKFILFQIKSKLFLYYIENTLYMSEIKRLRKVLNWLYFREYAENDSDFAQKIGYTKSSFSQIINGRVPLSEKFLNKVCTLNENINKVWITDGTGNMLKEDKREAINGHLSGNNINGNIGNIHINNSELSEKGKELYHEYQILLKENESLKREIELLKDMINILKERK